MEAAAGRTIRVLIAGDDPLARGGLAFLLSGQPGLTVVEQTDTLGAAAAAEGVDADVAVWDLGPDAAAWGERLPEAAASGPPILALVAMQGGQEGQEGQENDAAEEAAAMALAAGVRGLLARDLDGGDGGRLAAALRALASGLLVFDEPLLQPLLRPRPAPQAPLDPLTPRELEVLQLLAQGLSNRRIAERLGISEHTAKFHVNAIVTKLGAQTRTDAAIRAARLGLVLL